MRISELQEKLDAYKKAYGDIFVEVYDSEDDVEYTLDSTRLSLTEYPPVTEGEKSLYRVRFWL